MDIITDAKVKSKLYGIAQKYTKGRYHDTGWVPLHNFIKEAQSVIPSLSIIKSQYRDNGKMWVLAGGFSTPNGKQRACWININASWAGSVEDPSSVYDLSIVIETMAINNLDPESKQYVEDLFKVSKVADEILKKGKLWR